MNNGKSLIHSNKYLRDKKFRERMLIEHAVASARIEGITGIRAVLEKATGNGSRTSKRS